MPNALRAPMQRAPGRPPGTMQRYRDGNAAIETPKDGVVSGLVN